MKLIIDIAEEDYNNIEPFLNGQTIKVGFNLFKALEIIKNGTPIPKGHGDLVDRDDLLADSYCIDAYSGEEVNIVDVMTVETADAIIKADKESEGDNG